MPETKTQYAIVIRFSISELEADVNEKLINGWHCIGGISIHLSSLVERKTN